jgi:hypothetical protein
MPFARLINQTKFSSHEMQTWLFARLLPQISITS